MNRPHRPAVGGLFFNNSAVVDAPVFRIDHDQAFQQTTHLQYQPKSTGPWAGFNWRYESGLVAGAAPFAPAGAVNDPIDLTGLTGNQQEQLQLSCGSVRATLASPLVSCAPNLLSSPLVQIPAPGTENDDRNPPRNAPRHLFDIATGWDNIFHRDKYKTNFTFTALNVTGKVALYNFLSTFSGTHFVAPRSYTAQLAFTF